MFVVVIGGYMVMNIGVNDVFNNVGFVVGFKVISMGGVILIVVICEMFGVIIVGGEVVFMIKGCIVLFEFINDVYVFINVMLVSLFSGVLWLYVVILIGVFVFILYFVVGGIMGVGMVVVGMFVINWYFLLGIVVSWVILFLMGVLIVMFFLMFIKKIIVYKEDKKSVVLKVVFYLVVLMSLIFSWYLMIKVLKCFYVVGFEI